jgi:proline iminopeptidase
MTEQFVSRGDARIYIEVVGSGFPTFVIPVAWGMSHDFYQALLDPLLSAHLQLVYFDPVGTGRSSPLPPDWSPTMIVRDVEAVRAALGIEHMVLFGHASGGYHALAYALEFPEHVAAMILVNSFASYRRASEIGAPLLEHLATWPEFVQQAREIARVRLPPSEEFRAIYKEQRVVDLLDYGPHYIRLANIADRTSFNPNMHDDLAGDLTDRLPEIVLPVLLLVGEHDVLCPLEETQLIATQLPAARVVLFSASRHFPFVEEPDKFVAEVEDFLDGLHRESQRKQKSPLLS